MTSTLVRGLFPLSEFSFCIMLLQSLRLKGRLVSLFMKSDICVISTVCLKKARLALLVLVWKRCPCHGDSVPIPFHEFVFGASFSFQNLRRHPLMYVAPLGMRDIIAAFSLVLRF